MWILLDYFNINENAKVIRGTAFILVVSLFSTLVKAPFEIFRVMYVDIYSDPTFLTNDTTHTEFRARLNRLIIWFGEQLKAFILSLILGNILFILNPLLIFNYLTTNCSNYISYSFLVIYYCCLNSL